MKCSNVQKRIVEFEDRELPVKIAQHLEHCSTCKHAYEQSLHLRKLLSLKRYEKPSAEADERLTLSIHRTIQEHLDPHPEETGISAWEWLTLEPLPALRYAAAALLIAIVGIHLFMMPTLQTDENLTASISPDLPSTGTPSVNHNASYHSDLYASLGNLPAMTNGQSRDIQYGPLRSTIADYEY